MHLSELSLSPRTHDLIETAKIPTLHLLLSDCKLPPEALAKGRDALCSLLAARAVPLTDHPSPVPTASHALDAALSGGLPSTRVVQLAGSSLSGKTLIACSFAASALARGECVIWLETSSAVSDIHTRLAELVDEECLSRLLVIAVVTLEHAIGVLEAIKEDSITLNFLKPSDDAIQRALRRPRLVVLDSLAALVAPVLGLRKPGWTGHAAFNRLMALLRWLATHTGATVLLTNRVVRGADGQKPALGNLLACYVDVTMLLGRIEETGDGVDISVAVQSKRGPDRKVVVCLGEKGIFEDEVDDNMRVYQ